MHMYTCSPIDLTVSFLPCKRVYRVIRMQISVVGEFTQRNTNHPGHYRGRLLTLEQNGVIANVKDSWRNESGGFICIITFIHAATRRQLQFQSERVTSSKGEAKESAAKIAVLSLGNSIFLHTPTMSSYLYTIMFHRKFYLHLM